MLTLRQKQILDFITIYIKKRDIAPSLEEIKKRFRLSSISTIHQHIEALKRKGCLEKQKNQRRSIEINKPSKPQKTIIIPLLGIITAGKPVEAYEAPEKITVSKDLIRGGSSDYFALKVNGDSMINEGIFDGDTVIIRKQQTAENGETIVALINGSETTLKKIYREKNGFRLQPANPTLKPIFVKELEIQGKVISVIRNFEKPKEEPNDEEFREETIKYIKETDVSRRKSLGQYFTPKSIREALLSRLPKTKNAKILDPACGTGEFLLTAKKYFKNAQLHGWDIDKNLIRISQKLVPESQLKNIDSLLDNEYGKFDFVIGNPPYFEFNPPREIRNKFKEIINGRVNIFSLFIYQGLKWLKDGGYLAYVVPPSMNNGAYFQKLRKFIAENSNIEYLHIHKDPKLFSGALQATMLLILKKGENKGDYLFKKNGILIFSEGADYLKKLFKDKITLHDLGYKVKTGRLVWNQYKHLLTNEPKKHTPLIWAHNIGENKLKFPILRQDKPQYVRIKNYDIGPAIVVNRITGSINSAKLKAAIIPSGKKFIAENHVNVIFPPTKTSQLDFGFSNNSKQMNIPIKGIAEQLSSKEKLKAIRNITGSTQISKTELEKLFPITI